MRKSFLATLSAAFIACALACAMAAPAQAQNNICPTAPNGDSSNKCASTQFVQNAVGGGSSLPLTQNHFYIGNPSNKAADTALSGDCTYGVGGITCTNLQGVPVNPTGASTNDVLAYNGSSFVHNAIVTLINTACTLTPSTCASLFGFYNPAWYTSLQAAVNAANPGGIVYVGAGTYTLTSTLSMQPGVTLRCAQGATITQGNSQNLTNLIDFAANSANNAVIDGCTIDQNKANNTLGSSHNNINIGSANGVIVRNSTIQNGTGMGVKISTGTNWIIANNTIQNNFYSGVYAFSGTLNTVENGQIYGNQFLSTGAHGIILDATDFSSVRDNLVVGTLVTGLTVNYTNTTVTVTAGGTPFSNTCSATTICPGQFIVANGGGLGFNEIFISAITSSTVASTTSSPGTATGASAIGGSGDLIDVARTSNSRVYSNIFRLGAGSGIVVANEGDSADFGATLLDSVNNNLVESIGGYCIAVEQVGAGNPVEFLQFNGNHSTSCLLGGVSIYTGAAANPGAFNITGGSSLPTFVTIDGQVTEDSGAANVPYWLSLGSGIGTIFTGANTAIDMVNSGVAGGVGTVVLSAGWGTGAAVTNVVSYGPSFSMTITSGTTPGANPTITVPTPATGKTGVGAGKLVVNSTGAAASITGDQVLGVASKVFTFIGTPAASTAYTFSLSSN